MLGDQRQELHGVRLLGPAPPHVYDWYGPDPRSLELVQIPIGPDGSVEYEIVMGYGDTSPLSWTYFWRIVEDVADPYDPAASWSVLSGPSVHLDPTEPADARACDLDWSP